MQTIYPMSAVFKQAHCQSFHKIRDNNSNAVISDIHNVPDVNFAKILLASALFPRRISPRAIRQASIALEVGSKDPAMRGISESHFEILIKNTYKVLLTRGLVGTILFSVDPETQEYFKSIIR